MAGWHSLARSLQPAVATLFKDREKALLFPYKPDKIGDWSRWRAVRPGDLSVAQPKSNSLASSQRRHLEFRNNFPSLMMSLETFVAYSLRST